jgi:protein-tyrosine phosphatase
MRVFGNPRRHARILAATAIGAIAIWQWPASAQQDGRAVITAASVEQLDARTYQIEYEAEAAGDVAVFASTSPDALTSASPVASTRTSPVRVSLPDHTRRVYFHLKPVDGRVRVASIRRLPLEGSANFRDLGGYRASDGRFVRWGRLYRSDHLTNLTGSDYDYLSGLRIRVVCDLRTPGEQAKAPTRWAGDVPEIVSVSVLSDADLSAATAPLPLAEFQRRLTATGSVASTANYERFVMQYVASYKQVMRRLIDGPVPAVTHCTAGRDRTGVYSAIVLTALGVPWETVMSDYLLTNRYWLTDEAIARRQTDYQAQYVLPQPPPAEGVRRMMTLQPDTLEAAFAALRKRYDSFEGFLKDGLELSNRDLTALRSRFLEP